MACATAAVVWFFFPFERRLLLADLSFSTVWCAPATDPLLPITVAPAMASMRREPSFDVDLPVHACYHAGGRLALELRQ